MNLKADNTKIHPISDESLSLFQEIVSTQKWWREFLNTTSGMTQTQNLVFFQDIRDLPLNEEIDIQAFPVEDAQFPDMRKATETFAAEWQKISFFSHYILANLRVEEERYEEARQILNNWIKDNNDPEALQLRRETYLRPAKQLLEVGEYEKSRALLEDWLKIGRRDDEEALQLRRETYLRPAKQLLEGGEYEQSRALLEDWLKIDSRKEKGPVANWLKLDIRDEEAWQLRRETYLRPAKQLLEGGEYEQARALLEDWLKIDNRDDEEARRLRRETYLRPAKQLLEGGEYEQARALLEDWLKIDSRDEEAGRLRRTSYLSLAKDRMKARNFEVAWQVIQSWLKQNHDDTQARIFFLNQVIENNFYESMRPFLKVWISEARNISSLENVFLFPARELLKRSLYRPSRDERINYWYKFALDALEVGRSSSAATEMEYQLFSFLLNSALKDKDTLPELFNQSEASALYLHAGRGVQKYLSQKSEAKPLLRRASLEPAIAILMQENISNKQYLHIRNLLEDWLKIARDDEEARQVLRETYLRPAKQLLEGGEYEQARTLMENWLKIARDDEEARQVLRETYLRPAKQLLESGEYEQARAVMEDWLKIARDDEEAQQIRYLSLPKLELLPSALDFETMEQGHKDSDTIEVKHPFGDSVDYDTEIRNTKGRGANWLQIHSSDSGYRHKVEANRPGYLTIDVDIPVSEISLGIHVMRVKIIPDDRDMQASYLEVSVNIIFPRTRWLLETIGWGLGVGLPFLISYFLYMQGDEESASQILGQALAVYGLIFFFIWLFLTPHDGWD